MKKVDSISTHFFQSSRFDQFNCRTVDVDSPVIYPILALTGLFKFGAAGLYYDQGTKLSSSLGGSLGYLPGPTFSIFYNTQTKVKIVKIEAKVHKRETERIYMVH